MNTNNAIEDLRHRAAIYQQAAEYIAENFDDDEDVDIEEIVRDIERGNAERFEVFVSIDDNPEDADVLILDTANSLFVTWYKMEHFGRCLQSNITDSDAMDEFIKRFKEQSIKED